MARNVKRAHRGILKIPNLHWHGLVEASDSSLGAAPQLSKSGVPARGWTKQLSRVKIVTRDAERDAARSMSWRLETLAFPTAAFQNGRLSLQRAGPVGRRLGVRAASGQSLVLRSLCTRPSRAGGPSQATRSGTRAPRCLRDRGPPTERFLQHLCLRSSVIASVRPLAPRHGRRGSWSVLAECWLALSGAHHGRQRDHPSPAAVASGRDSEEQAVRARAPPCQKRASSKASRLRSM